MPNQTIYSLLFSKMHKKGQYFHLARVKWGKCGCCLQGDSVPTAGCSRLFVVVSLVNGEHSGVCSASTETVQHSTLLKFNSMLVARVFFFLVFLYIFEVFAPLHERSFALIAHSSVLVSFSEVDVAVPSVASFAPCFLLVEEMCIAGSLTYRDATWCDSLLGIKSGVNQLNLISTAMSKPVAVLKT